MTEISLGVLAALVGGETDAPEALVKGCTHDSRAVEPGQLYFAVPGTRFDGHEFLDEALRSAAGGAVVERPVATSLPTIVVPSVRQAMGPIAHAVYGNPSASVQVLGVTGTNGKTSVVTMAAQLGEALGISVDVIGTLTGARTTPEAPELAAALAQARDRGVRLVAMEVSSHALDQRRVDGMRFMAAGFTNLSVDHLDYHANMEEYFEAKASLFTADRVDLGVINVDDPYGRELAARAQVPVVKLTTPPVELHPDQSSSSVTWRGIRLELALVGSHTIANALMAAELCHAAGFPVADIAAAARALRPAPGRFETIDEGQPFTVVVDYAHTPDGLASVLRVARELARDHQVITVFGAGGDRDKSKRPLMGAAAEQESDFVIVTNDNPRSEVPEEIAREICDGIQGTRFAIELDRREAIRRALKTATPGDVVMICGKGHETTQTTGDVVVDFDDRVVTREVLCELLHQGGVA